MTRPTLLASLLATSLFASLGAQSSPYYVMAGDQSTFSVLLGGQVVHSWQVPAGTATYQYPIVVTGTIRTMGANAGDIGAEYDLSGNDIGTRYTHPTGAPNRTWDATTDGVHNYSIDSNGLVFRYDRDWNNPLQLFDAGSIGAITYDPSNNSLWVSQFSATNIVNYTMAGNLISSFDAGHAQNMALAMDHADGTLWLHNRTTRGTFEQWSTSGTLLNRIAIPGMDSQNALGGEFQFAGSASCSLRNGSGVNPIDFSCRTPPMLGATWTTTYNHGPNTTGTVLWACVQAGSGNGLPGITQGEVLVSLPTLAFTLIGTGDISVPLPLDLSLVGFPLTAQGLRVESVGTPVVLLNAQDLVIGY